MLFLNFKRLKKFIYVSLKDTVDAYPLADNYYFIILATDTLKNLNDSIIGYFNIIDNYIKFI
jgi:hypothetical protein